MSSSLHIHYTDEASAAAYDRGDYRRVLPSEYDHKPLTVSFDILKDLMRHARELTDSIQTLRQPDQDTRLNSDHIQAELSDELSEFLDACWELIPIAKRPSAQSAVLAQKLFDTPELLENVLIHLKIRDTLAAQQAGRVWRDSINGSVQLQRAMGLRFDEAAIFSLLSATRLRIPTCCPTTGRRKRFQA